MAGRPRGTASRRAALDAAECAVAQALGVVRRRQMGRHVAGWLSELTTVGRGDWQSGAPVVDTIEQLSVTRPPRVRVQVLSTCLCDGHALFTTLPLRGSVTESHLRRLFEPRTSRA